MNETKHRLSGFKFSKLSLIKNKRSKREKGNNIITSDSRLNMICLLKFLKTANFGLSLTLTPYNDQTSCICTLCAIITGIT